MDPRGRIRGFKKLPSVEFRKMQQLVGGRRSDEGALELQQGSSEARERLFQEEQLPVGPSRTSEGMRKGQSFCSQQT